VLTLAGLLLSGGCNCQHDDERTVPRPAKASKAPPQGPTLRPARLAGSWYAKDPLTLRKRLAGWLKQATVEERDKTPAGSLLGVVAPHAGYRFSGRTAASVYRLVARAKPKRLFVIGPSHYARIRSVAVVDGERFDTPLGALTMDQAARAALLKHTLFVRAPRVDRREHSVELQMPFIAHVAPRAKVVPLIVGALTLHEVRRVADAIRALLRPGDLVVASSDFTHRGPRYRYQPFAGRDVPRHLRELDHRAFRRLEAGDLAAFWRFKHRTGDTICGFYPASILRAILGPKVRGTLLRYDTSSRVSPQDASSVSYLAIAFSAPPTSPGADPWATSRRQRTPRFLSRVEASYAVRIARRALQAHFKSPGARFDAAAAKLAPAGKLRERHGVFVTLKRSDGRLRGCIGHVVGRLPLHRGIVENALNAALRDSRFKPVTKAELRSLHLEVTVLTPPKAVSGPEAITIGRDGVILRKHHGGRQRAALFLPQIAVEQGWDLRRTLEALARKAGLGVGGWRGGSFSVFQGYVYDE
jgi:AmmeMemoRadiSam system protein B/AmmeMemoRadiSam system protein A